MAIFIITSKSRRLRGRMQSPQCHDYDFGINGFYATHEPPIEVRALRRLP